MNQAQAAREIGSLVNRIMALAKEAGLHVGIKITPLDLAKQIDTFGADSLLPRCNAHKPVQHRDGKPPWCGKCGMP